MFEPCFPRVLLKRSLLPQIDEKRSIPRNALLLSAGISIALSLIYIGSDTAFYAIISLNVVALMSTYSRSTFLLRIMPY